MNFLEMQQDVLARLDEKENTELQASVKTWLNQAYQDVCNRYNWPFLEAQFTLSTVDGTESYGLTGTNVKKIYDVIYTDSGGDKHRLQPMTLDVFKKLYTGETQTSSGTPDYYYIWNDNIYLYPIPDYSGTDNLLINYYTYPNYMTNDTDEPLIPLPYHEVLVLGACVRARQYNDESTPEAELIRREYEEKILHMINDLSNQEGTEANYNIDFQS